MGRGRVFGLVALAWLASSVAMAQTPADTGRIEPKLPATPSLDRPDVGEMAEPALARPTPVKPAPAKPAPVKPTTPVGAPQGKPAKPQADKPTGHDGKAEKRPSPKSTDAGKSTRSTGGASLARAGHAGGRPQVRAGGRGRKRR